MTVRGVGSATGVGDEGVWPPHEAAAAVSAAKTSARRMPPILPKGTRRESQPRLLFLRRGHRVGIADHHVRGVLGRAHVVVFHRDLVANLHILRDLQWFL